MPSIIHWPGSLSPSWSRDLSVFPFRRKASTRIDTNEPEPLSPRRFKASLPHSRFILMLGFGGLLLLMVFTGIDGIHTLRQIQKSNDEVREEFLSRTRKLEKIRSDVYLSGTYIRDYLLEPEPGKAESHRRSLLQARADMDSALGKYKRLLSHEEVIPFQTLTHELGGYWKVLEPVFRWNAAERRQHGYAFLRDEVFPRRMAMLGIADKIANISESQLVAGKVQMVATFSNFRSRLIITIGLTIGLGLLLAGFTTGKILRLERETAGRYHEIATARTQLKQLSARLVEAQEEERRSISRELHDEVGQSLSGVLVELANLSTGIRARDFAAVEAKVYEIKKLVEDSVGVLRNMALLLRPSMLDDLGLVPALQWQAREVSKRTGVRVRVIAEDVPEDLPEEYNTCIYRIVQEALHNCIQHAAARIVKVTVQQQAGDIMLKIEDDGKGFNAGQERGMGLIEIQERVSYLAGAFRVESEPGSGTVLYATLPVSSILTQHA
jgi:signal transduction histidine kinase